MSFLPALVGLLPRGAARHAGRILGGGLGEVVADVAAAGRLDPIALCRRLTLVGWSRLPPIGQALVVLVPPAGNPEAAVWPFGLYRGGIGLLVPPSVLDRAGAAARARFGVRPLAVESAAQALQQGGQVAVRAAAGLGGAAEAPWKSAGLAALALASGAVVLPVHAEHASDGGYRVCVGEPITPPRADDSAQSGFAERCASALERARAARPGDWLSRLP